jgi:hypothetical protein
MRSRSGIVASRLFARVVFTGAGNPASAAAANGLICATGMVVPAL